jgi:hypothetical protein
MQVVTKLHLDMVLLLLATVRMNCYYCVVIIIIIIINTGNSYYLRVDLTSIKIFWHNFLILHCYHVHKC